MTQINRNELNQIQYVDQALLWCVVELEHSNHHPDNYYLSDNAAIRAESMDYISWQVIQDDQGNGQFIFTGLLPIRNSHPLLDQTSIIETVKSYTEFKLTDELITFPTDGQGMRLPPLPSYIDSMEKLLVWLVRIVEGVNRYIAYVNYWIKKGVNPPTDPQFALDENGNVTLLNLSPIIEVETADSAEGMIGQYENPLSDDTGFPDWFQEAINNGGGYVSPNNTEPDPVDAGNGNEPSKFDTLPVCKEQDPTVNSLSANNLQELLTK